MGHYASEMMCDNCERFYCICDLRPMNNKYVNIWQPIETAPRDGTEILVYFLYASVPMVHIAWYRNLEEWESGGKYCGGWDTLEEWEGWWTYSENSLSQKKLEGNTAPTHWMPYSDPVENTA